MNIKKSLKNIKYSHQNRKKYILQIILIGLLILSLLAAITTLVGSLTSKDSYTGVPPLIMLVFTIYFLFLLFLLKKDKVETVLNLVIATILLIIGNIFYVSGVQNSHGLLLFSFFIVLISILVDTKKFPYYAFSLLLLYGVVSYLQLIDIFNPRLGAEYSPLRYHDIIAYLAILFIIAWISWINNREIDKYIQKIIDSELALKRERDLLEVRVKERTKQLYETELQLFKFAKIGRLTAGLFHDLKNTLMVISLNLSKIKQFPDAKKYSKQALEATSEIDRLIKSAGRELQEQKSIESFSVNEAIKEVVQILKYKALKNNVVVETKINTQCSLKGNPIKFHQLISNLVTNSIEAYDDIDRKTSRQVLIEVSQAETNCIIKITDWGRGISKVELKKIFNLFYTTKDPDKGTGIGLVICKDIVEEDFKGKITATSESKAGTEFIITLPIKK